MVVALPWGVDQQEAERLRGAQIAHLVLAARRDGAERARRHADRAGAVVAAVADLALPGDHEEQIPDPRVHVRGELFAGFTLNRLASDAGI